MITRSLDANHDFCFGKGRSDYLDENAALTQNIDTRLMSFINDCFFDLGAGVDWFAYLGTKNVTGLKLAVSAVITQTVGVIELKEIKFTLDENRALLVQYEVNSAWSTTVGSSVNLG